MSNEEAASQAEFDEVADSGEPIPYKRFARLHRTYAQARSRAEAAEAKAAELEQRLASHGEQAQQWEQLQSELETLRSERDSWATEREIMGAGISDAEGLDFVRLAWSRVPEDQRPEGGLKAWLSEADKLPKAVRAYLPASDGGGAQQAQPRQPSANAGAQPYTGAPRNPNVSHDPKEYAKQRDAVFGGKAPVYPWQKPQQG